MTTHKLTRRALLAASLGAAQFALLDRFGLLPNARADVGSDGPTKLLVLYLKGGVRFYPVFLPLSDAEIGQYIPPPTATLGEPIFYRPSDIVSLDGDSGGFQPLRIGRNWNPADPGDRMGYTHSPMGYGWIHYGLGPSTAVLHGLDHGSFAHGSAYVSAMCGVPGEAYRAPSLVSVVANHLASRFSSTRPIPCVAISANDVPQNPGLPAQSSPAVIPSREALAALFSSDAMRNTQWRGSDQRTPRTIPKFDGMGTYDNVGLTNVDALVLERTRALRGSSSTGTDAVLEQIYGSYAAVSQTLARDVVSAVQAVMPVTQTQPDYARAYGMFNFTFGAATGRIDMTNSCEWILRLLKSNVTSVVYANLPERYYDFHNGTSIPTAVASARAQLDIVARMLGEKKATPSPDRPGRTLYDDTLVVIQSEFGRTWMAGPNQDSTDGWQFGDDHNPITSAILSGGGILGNRQIGGFQMSGTAGMPVQIVEETGTMVTRAPRSADFVSTVCRVFGMRPGADYFIPGGYGAIQGVCP